jgi:anti-sigma regulatory factor (Ser/Thr protein kinase)
MTTILRMELSAPTTADVPLVRRSVRSAATVVGASALDDIELVASELVANAVVHGVPPVVVRTRLIDQHLQVEVDDHHPDQPLPTNGTLTEERGRGLLVVAAIASDWGWRIDERGTVKTVWAQLPLHAENGEAT